MSEDRLKLVYNTLRSNKTLGQDYKDVSFEQFRDVLSNNPDARRDVFQDLKSNDLVSRDNADDYWTAVGIIKPKPTLTEKVKNFLAPPKPTNPSSQTASQIAGKPIEVQQRPIEPEVPYFKQWESQAEIEQASKSPVFKDNKLAQEAMQSGLIMPTKEAEQAFNERSSEEQQAIIQGTSGYETSQQKANEARGFGQKTKDFGATVLAGGKNIAKNLLAGLKYTATLPTRFTTLSMANPTAMAEGILAENQARKEMYQSAKQAENDFARTLAERNIDTSILGAIESGNTNRIPEATLYTVAESAMQIIPAIFTFGGSSYLQTLPDAYKAGVDAIAKQKGITPEEVIASGDDAIVIAEIGAGLASALDYAGASSVGKVVSTKAGMQALRESLAKGALSATNEGLTEGGQEAIGILGEIGATSESAKEFLKKLPDEFFKPENIRRINEAVLAGAVGGAGLVTGGKLGRRIVDSIEQVPVAAQESAAVVETPEGEKVVYEQVEVSPEEFDAYKRGEVDPDRLAGLQDSVAKAESVEEWQKIDPLYAQMLEAEYAKQPQQQQPTPEPTEQIAEVEEEGAQTPQSFAQDLAAGAKKDSPEDQQFYENNAEQIEAELKRMAEEEGVLDIDAELARLEALQNEEELVPLADEEAAASMETGSAVPAASQDAGARVGASGVDVPATQPGGPENQGEVVQGAFLAPDGKILNLIDAQEEPTSFEIKQKIDQKIIQLKEDKELIIKCPPGMVWKAKDGAQFGFTKGGKWEILTQFRGRSHETGGIDIELGDGKFRMSNKNGEFKAKFGVVIPCKK
jgi:hypothetical protein